MRTINDYWTMDQMGGGASPLYVYLSPPGAAAASLRFNLAGLNPALVARLAKLGHGDPVPEAVASALEALPGHEVVRGSFGGAASGRQQNRRVEVLLRAKA